MSMSRHGQIALSGCFGILLLALVASYCQSRTPGAYAAQRVLLGRNAISASARASEKVVNALDPAARAQGRLEQGQLGTAETLAGLGGRADRAVVLDQQK